MSKEGSEPWVKDGIKAWLRTLKAWWYMPVQMGMGEGGIHDFIACIPVKVTSSMVGKTIGMFVSIEAKEQGVVETLIRQADKGGKHSFPAKDRMFISNRALQTLQADEIHAARGQAWIIDDPLQCLLRYHLWQEGLDGTTIELRSNDEKPT